jgi:hypothetical protein
MAAWENYKVKRQLEHTDFRADPPASKRARESTDSGMLQGDQDVSSAATQAAKRARELEGLQGERSIRPSERLQLERDRALADDSPSQQHLFDLDNLKSLQRLNAKHDASLKYVPLRNMLVSFVNDLCEEHKLMSITVHRAMNYLDRLLSR